MAAKFIILFACIALSCGAKVRRDAPAEPAQPDPLAEFQKTFSEQLNAIVNSKNTESVSKALKEGSDSVLQQLSVLSESLQKAMNNANGKARDALEQTRKNLDRTAEDLRKAHPEVEKQATALKDKLQTAVQNTMQETQKLSKELAKNMEQTNMKLSPTVKAATDDFIKQMQLMQKNIHEAANKE